MNYIDYRAKTIGELCGMDCCNAQDMQLLRIYAVLSFTKGLNTTLKDVHDAWSAWRADTEPDHKSLVHFHKLTYDVQQLDAPYCEAIRKASVVRYCSFCGKGRREVNKLIGGQGSVICNECIKQCRDLLEEES